MSTPMPPSTEPNAQQVLAARLIWFGQTIASTLLIGFVMLQVVPGMVPALPTVQLAPREALVGGIVVLGAVLLMVGKHLRATLYSPAPLATAATPLQRALARLNANSALVAGLLDAPFLVGVALYMLDRDPWLLAAGAWVPLFGGVMLWPDPLRDCRVLMQR